MDATVITRLLEPDATAVASDLGATSRTPVNPSLGNLDSSHLLLRSAFASLVLTLILLPGGFRALEQTGMGWEAWSFSRFLILSLVVCHLLCCWIPLAARYFKRGECRDIPAFLIATATLFTQGIIGYGLFAYYSFWNS